MRYFEPTQALQAKELSHRLFLHAVPCLRAGRYWTCALRREHVYEYTVYIYSISMYNIFIPSSQFVLQSSSNWGTLCSFSASCPSFCWQIAGIEGRSRHNPRQQLLCRLRSGELRPAISPQVEQHYPTPSEPLRSAGQSTLQRTGVERVRNLKRAKASLPFWLSWHLADCADSRSAVRKEDREGSCTESGGRDARAEQAAAWPPAFSLFWDNPSQGNPSEECSGLWGIRAWLAPGIGADSFRGFARKQSSAGASSPSSRRSGTRAPPAPAPCGPVLPRGAMAVDDRFR